MNTTLLAMAAAGFALHFLGRYGEFWRTGVRVWPHTYLAQDWPGWLSALISTVAAFVALPELAPLMGLSVDLTPLGAITIGYTGSSLGAKLPALITGRGVR